MTDNKHNSNGHQTNEHQKDEQWVSSLYQTYNQDMPVSPPSTVDDRILAMAKARLKNNKKNKGQLVFPTSIAASIFLVVVVYVNIDTVIKDSQSPVTLSVPSSKQFVDTNENKSRQEITLEKSEFPEPIDVPKQTADVLLQENFIEDDVTEKLAYEEHQTEIFTPDIDDEIELEFIEVTGSRIASVPEFVLIRRDKIEQLYLQLKDILQVEKAQKRSLAPNEGTTQDDQQQQRKTLQLSLFTLLQEEKEWDEDWTLDYDFKAVLTKEQIELLTSTSDNNNQ